MFYRKQIEVLNEWRISTTRKPLVIRGARQVGKTTLVNEFGKQFDQYIYINLEKGNEAQFFKNNDDIQTLVEKIFIDKRKLLSKADQTLLFIDEIQEVPKAINMLRYFKEDFPQLAVIAAGSMLETLMGKNLTFPVGRVEYRVLRPLSFEEFLIAMGEDILLEKYRTVPLSNVAENALLKAFHTYALIGGMPEVVQKYSENKDITSLAPIYDALINSYLEDAEKYADDNNQLHLIRFSIPQAMANAGKRITFQKFGNSNYSPKKIREVLFALEKTHLLHILYPVTSPVIPLDRNYNKTPRIQFLDSGMLNYFLGLQKDIIGSKDLNNVYQGTLIEHLVGQELLSFQNLSLKKLHFWVREKKQSDAEIDFIHSYNGKIIPIEVKSGAKGRLRSLQVFMDSSPHHYAIRFYAGKSQLDEITTKNGKTFYLLSLPYFLAAKVEYYIEWLMKEVDGKLLEQSTILNESKGQYKKSKPKAKKWELSQLKKKHFKLLSLCSNRPQKGRYLIEEGLNLSYQTRNKNEYIRPLFDLDLIEFTNKEFEKSKNQKYQITKKGLELLEKQC